MKKIILVLAVVGLFLPGFAQDQAYRIGFKFNPNVSWLRPDAKEITNNGTAFRFGFALNVDHLFTSNYAFGTGVNISQSGGELVYLESTTKNSVPVILERTRDYHLQFAEIPLTLKLRTNEIGYITYWGQFGLGLGFNIRAKGNDAVDYKLEQNALGIWSESDLASYSEEDVDIKSDINIFRASLIVGGGIEYNISGSTSLILGLTFNNGFTDVLNGNGVKTDEADSPVFENGEPVQYKLKAVNNYIELNVGVLF